MLKAKRLLSGVLTVGLVFTAISAGVAGTMGISVSAAGSTEVLLSQGKPASASSFQTGNEVSKGNDGDTAGTRWAAASAAMPQWWRVDLGQAYNLTKLAASWYDSTNRYFQYKIEISTDDSSFMTVVDKTGNTTKGNSSDTFSAIGRYVRITVTGTSMANGFASAYEFQVYGYERGASKPWVLYNTPTAFQGVSRSGTTPGSIAYEAYGRSYTELNNTGDYASFTSTVNADKLTIRYSIPRGTPDSTISLYINDVDTANITLKSNRIWGDQEQVPGGYFHFFDEVQFDQNITSGDVIKLKKDEDNTASQYCIDFIELENAPDALSMPATGYVSVKTYGGAKADGSDDAAAIQATMRYAKDNRKSVWIDIGNYTIGTTVTVPSGVTVKGAGIWHSKIIRNFGADTPMPAFHLDGANTVMNFTITDANAKKRVNGNEGIELHTNGTNFTIDSMWVKYSYGAGIFGSSISNSTIRNCRVRSSYADSIHLADKSHDNTITNNMIRTAGDDGIALVAYSCSSNARNTVTNNLVECNYWGRGISIIGGDGNAAMYNEVTDSAFAAGIYVAVESYNSPTQYCTNFTVKYNHVTRCGNSSMNQYGAIWVYGQADKPMSGQIDSNGIWDEVRNGIVLLNYVDSSVTVCKNTIDAPGASGQHIWTSLASGHNPVVSDNILK